MTSQMMKVILQGQWDAAVELVRAQDNLRETTRWLGIATKPMTDRLATAQAEWDRSRGVVRG